MENIPFNHKKKKSENKGAIKKAFRKALGVQIEQRPLFPNRLDIPVFNNDINSSNFLKMY